MNISHRHRYLYFVIPKAGSATVRHSLKEFTDIGYPVTQFEQHLSINQFLKMEGAKKLYKRYFKFTFVRNPYDRLYSGYKQDQLASQTWRKWVGAKQPIFDRIGDDFNIYLQDYVSKADIKNEWDWICFCPMTEFSHKRGRYNLDWYGKTENLERDLDILGDKLGIKIAKADDKNVKTSPQKRLKYISRYTRKSIELVNSIYSKDFDFFGYTKQDPADFPEVL